MRVSRRSLNGEEGVFAVLIILALTFLLGMVSLSVDGGFLFLKRRAVVNANDAASLAAALSCAKSEGQGAADTQADLLAVDNVANATRFAAPAYDPSCDAPSGKVTVSYQADQALFFSQVVGVSSPKVVRTDATATWGGAGGANQIVPMMLNMNRLSTCDIPFGVNQGEMCGFWWNNGNNPTSQDLTNAEWGFMDLNTWGFARTASCPGNTTPPQLEQWMLNGYSGPLLLADTPPTYVCRGSGAPLRPLMPSLTELINRGEPVPFPVNDPAQQVEMSGALCPPTSGCSVAKYAIVGFGWLTPVAVYKGDQAGAAQNCPGHPSDPNARCLVARWDRFSTSGLAAGGGQNFGLVAVTLSG